MSGLQTSPLGPMTQPGLLTPDLARQVGEMMAANLTALRAVVDLVGVVIDADDDTAPTLATLQVLAHDAHAALRPALEAHHALARTLSASAPVDVSAPDVLPTQHETPVAPRPTKDARHEGPEST